MQGGGNNSSEIGGNAVTTVVRTIAREMRPDKGNAATTTGYCGDGGGEVDSDGGGKSKGSAATSAGYRGNGGGGNEDDGKGNSGKNGECGGNNRGGVSHLSLFSFILFFGPAQDTVTRFVFLLDTYCTFDLILQPGPWNPRILLSLQLDYGRAGNKIEVSLGALFEDEDLGRYVWS